MGISGVNQAKRVQGQAIKRKESKGPKPSLYSSVTKQQKRSQPIIAIGRIAPFIGRMVAFIGRTTYGLITSLCQLYGLFC